MSSVWQEISTTVIAEFSQFTDVAEITRVSTRLLIAALLGGLLGFEREQRGKAAGVRTHMLVCIGAAVFVIIPLQAGASAGDLGRVMQGIITGIGFLGAGAILKGDDEKSLKGLTTAAGIWLTAAIGIAAGFGHESSAILCTFLALIVLIVVPKLIALFNRSDEQE